ACSMHHSTACPCSSCESVGLSPVVPTGTRPSVPSAICQSTRPRKTFSSSAPLPKGVTNAVNEPRKLVLAVMVQSSGSSRDSLPMPYCTDQLQTPQLHSAELLLPDEKVKKIRPPPCRLFAAVRVDGPQLSPSSRFYQISIHMPATDKRK